MSDVTPFFDAAASGDRKAVADLLPLVYDELRKLAAVRMAAEDPGHTLDATALVHEVFLKLGTERSFATKTDYFKAAAEAMRRILVDHARARNAAKRARGLRVNLKSGHLVHPPPNDDLSALDEALSQLAIDYPQHAELVQLRYFGGLTLAECAEVLGVSARTADTWWSFARAWLVIKLSEGRQTAPGNHELKNS